MKLQIPCRYCGDSAKLEVPFGYFPNPNALLLGFEKMVPTYPLGLYQCPRCGVIQTNSPKSETLFDLNYPYESSVNQSYVAQCQELVVECVNRFSPKTVLEIGANDGYLLQFFPDDVEVLGIEPVSHLCVKGEKRGVRMRDEFFGSKTNVGTFDLVIANNVCAHLPDLFDFFEGLRKVCKVGTKVIVEVHDFEHMIRDLQWDSIYYEHFEHWTRDTLWRTFANEGFHLLEMREIPSHGGSLRAYFEYTNAQPSNLKSEPLEFFQFENEVQYNIRSCLSDILALKNSGKIFCYGAAAKGIQFLNMLGLKSPLIEACFEDTESKIGKFIPGANVPIIDSKEMQTRLSIGDSVIILPWNFAKEIKAKVPLFVNSYVKTAQGLQKI